MCTEDCFCGSCFLGEITHNVKVGRKEHNPTESSKPPYDLIDDIDHHFISSAISKAPKSV